MASRYPNGMAAPVAKTMAQMIAEAEAKSKAALDKQQQFADFVRQGEEAFKKKYGAYPKDYVLDKKLAAYEQTSQANNFKGRSRRGKQHAREPEKLGTKGDVKAYHDMEEVAKECARSGDIQGAIDGYSEAADMREDFEKKHSKAPDAGHAQRVVMLRQRRNSLIGLKNSLDSTDPDVVAAKLVVSNFFMTNNVKYSV